MNIPPIVSQQDWDAAREQLLVKEKSVLRAHDALAAEHVDCHLVRESGFFNRIDEHRVAALIIDLCAAAKALGLRMNECLDAGFKHGAHLAIERTHRQFEARRTGNNVVGGAGLEHTDRNHRHQQWVGVARHDGLQTGNQRAGGDQRLVARMRPCRMAADALKK